MPPKRTRQAGISTYVVSDSLSHTGTVARMKSWYMKAKNSAVGSSFDYHVVGGYQCLMRFYCPGDEIYIFGFSRTRTSLDSSQRCLTMSAYC